jgi:hypothetical protein
MSLKRKYIHFEYKKEKANKTRRNIQPTTKNKVESIKKFQPEILKQPTIKLNKFHRTALQTSKKMKLKVILRERTTIIFFKKYIKSIKKNFDGLDEPTNQTQPKTIKE